MKNKPTNYKVYDMVSEEYREYLLAYYHRFTDFIEAILPNYHKSEEILEADILWRFILDEAISENDLKFIKTRFSTKKEAAERLIQVETEITKICLEEFYGEYFREELSNV